MITKQLLEEYLLFKRKLPKDANIDSWSFHYIGKQKRKVIAIWFSKLNSLDWKIPIDEYLSDYIVWIRRKKIEKILK